MKIKNKMLLNNLLIGIAPVLLAFIISFVIINIQAANRVRKNLDIAMEDIKSQIDQEMSRFAYYSYFNALLAGLPEYRRLINNQIVFRVPVEAKSSDFKIIEFFYRNTVSVRDFSSVDYAPFCTFKEIADAIWDKFNDPAVYPGFKMALPYIISNTLVVKNCASIYEPESREKLGFAVISVPFDVDFLKRISGNNPDLVLFIDTTNGIIFSQMEFNTPELVKMIDSQTGSSPEPYRIVNLHEKGNYYLYKQRLYSSLKKTPKKKPVYEKIADIGILYGFHSVNAITNIFQSVNFFVIFFSIIGAFLISKYILFPNIVLPIMRLKDMVVNFNLNKEVIPSPEVIHDEISLLQESFSEMSIQIIDTQNKLEKTKKISEDASYHKSQFLANMSHELRTPLNSINGIADLLRFGSYEKNDEIVLLLREILSDLKGGKTATVEAYAEEIEAVRGCLENDGNLKKYFLRKSMEELGSLDLGETGREIIREKWKRILDLLDQEEHEVFNAYSHIKDSGDYLLAMIDNVLNLTKVEAGKIEINKTEVRMKDIINSIIIDTQSYAKSKRKDDVLKLVFSADDDLPETLLIDKQKIRQVMLNLISNSIKFSERGAVKIDFRRDGENICFSVADEGIGIKEEDKDKVFQEFSRTADAKFIEGTGLGLVLSKRLIEKHGGTIGFESDYGKGSRFWFTVSARADNTIQGEKNA